MSLAATRSSLIHRVTIQRNASVGSDDGWGNPLPPEWYDNLIDIQCYGWTDIGAYPRIAPKAADATIIVIADRHVMVPFGTDVTEADRLDDITYRGAVFLPGPMGIEAVLTYPEHLELILFQVK